MGINAGAFLGILLCGYIGETVGWSYGFGLAMLFMVAGAVQFWLSGKMFGTVGLKPENDGIADVGVADTNPVTASNSKRFTTSGIIALVVGVAVYFLGSMIPEFHNSDSTLSMVNTIFMPSIILGAFTGIISFIVADPGLDKIERDRVWVIVILTFFTIFFWWAFEQAGGSMTIFASDYTSRDLAGGSAMTFKIFNTLLTIVPLIVITWVLSKLFQATFKDVGVASIVLGLSFVIIWAIVIWMLYTQFQSAETEVPASWFGILNSFFIIAFAPLFSKFWDLKIIRSGPIKFALGLALLATGFAILAWGSAGIEQGAKTASVSMMWLILAYLFHTLGELCLSPVGLSYVSKLAPLRLIGLMFGVFFIANFIANFAGGITGSYIDKIVESSSMSTFFLIFTVVPGAAALVLVLLNGILKKMMHGIE